MNGAELISAITFQLELLMTLNRCVELIAILIVLVLSGLLGGAANFYFKQSAEKLEGSQSLTRSMLLGLVAALTAPLFLYLLKLNIIWNNDMELFQRLLILLGICLILALFSERFLESIAQRLLMLKQLNAKIEKTQKAQEVILASKELKNLKNLVRNQRSAGATGDRNLSDSSKIISTILDSDQGIVSFEYFRRLGLVTDLQDKLDQLEKEGLILSYRSSPNSNKLITLNPSTSDQWMSLLSTSTD